MPDDSKDVADQGQDRPSAAPTPQQGDAGAVEQAASGARRVLVVGCVPGCGASSVAWAVASASSGFGPVLVQDAGSPRRSALRGLCSVVGSTTDLGPGVALVDGGDGPMQLRFVQADDVDTRVDDVSAWPVAAGAAMTVADVGISCEEMLTTGSGESWLTAVAAQDSCVVLVVPTSVSTDARCEAVLSQWVDRGWAQIDQVVSVGAARGTGASTTGPLLTQALSGATPMPYLEQIWSFGLPPVAAWQDPSVAAWAAAGQQVAGLLSGRGPVTPARKRRFLRRGG